MTLWSIQHRLILICFTLLTHPKPTLLVTNSFLFENISTSHIRTHSFMTRLILLLSTIERVGTEYVKPSGMFTNPIVISFTTQSHVLMCRLTPFTSMLAPTLLSIVPLYCLTSFHRHNANFKPQVSGFNIGKRSLVLLLPPYFFIVFTSHIMGPFGVWRAASPRLNEESQFHIPLFFPNWLRHCSVLILLVSA